MWLYSFLKPIGWVLVKIIYNVKVNGQENIPKEGKFIFSSNHIHALDPILLAVYTPKRQIRFMSKVNLFKKGFLNWFFTSLGCIPVNRDGNDINSIKKAIKVLKNNEILGIYPEGTRNKSDDCLLEIKPGLPMIAIKTKTKIVPVWIKGEYKFRGKIHLNFGKPFELEEYYGKKKIEANEYSIIGNEVIGGKMLNLREGNVDDN